MLRLLIVNVNRLYPASGMELIIFQFMVQLFFNVVMTITPFAPFIP